MGKKKLRQFAETVQDLASKRGIRMELLILSDEDLISGFSTYKSKEDARAGMVLLLDMIKDISEMGEGKI